MLLLLLLLLLLLPLALLPLRSALRLPLLPSGPLALLPAMAGHAVELAVQQADTHMAMLQASAVQETHRGLSRRESC